MVRVADQVCGLGFRVYDVVSGSCSEQTLSTLVQKQGSMI